MLFYISYLLQKILYLKDEQSKEIIVLYFVLGSVENTSVRYENMKTVGQISNRKKSTTNHRRRGNCPTLC